MDARKRRGNEAESAACAHLRRAGLEQVAANANFRCGELDLVMLERLPGGDILVFVEVRYRRHRGFGGGAASVDAGKRRRLVRAAAQFLAMHPRLSRLPCRFDVVEAGGDAGAQELRWIRDAFRADEA